MQPPLKIIIIEDLPSDVELLKKTLTRGGIDFTALVIQDREAFIKAIEEFQPDLVISDHSLPKFNSLEALEIAKEDSDNLIPFILVTGTVSEEFAVECMKAGADDYILKGSLLRLPSAVKQLISNWETRKEKQSIELLNKKLQRANDIIKAKNDEITSNVIYAKEIQQSLLSNIELLHQYFSEAFVLFKPKDIVSGDFYWFSKLENDELLLVVADCTGHGIAGAFMSIIGTSLLNEIVYGKQLTKPSEILDELEKKINLYLGQSHGGLSKRDSLLDVGICKINKEKRVLEFGGANIPMYRFRKNQLEVIKPDLYGIGGMKPKDFRPYNTFMLPYEEDDFIYLFTDGYIDQFGGENDEKVKATKFSKLLTSVQQHNAQEQQKILDHWLNEWMYNKEQTDDILVVGVRL